jgi:hypothetical protein
MLENYIRLLGYINSQMDTDEIDCAERDADTMKRYIEYYLENLDEEYIYELKKIIPLEILKEKILDVAYGFGDPTCEIDLEFMHRIQCDLYNEIDYRINICKCTTVDRTEGDECWQCRVRDCGCKADRTCCGKY